MLPRLRSLAVLFVPLASIVLTACEKPDRPAPSAPTPPTASAPTPDTTSEATWPDLKELLLDENNAETDRDVDGISAEVISCPKVASTVSLVDPIEATNPNGQSGTRRHDPDRHWSGVVQVVPFGTKSCKCTLMETNGSPDHALGLVSFELLDNIFSVAGRDATGTFIQQPRVALPCLGDSACSACGVVPEGAPTEPAMPGLKPPVLISESCVHEGHVVDGAIVGARDGQPVPTAECGLAEPGGSPYVVFQTTHAGTLMPRCSGVTTLGVAGIAPASVALLPGQPAGSPSWIVVSADGWHQPEMDAGGNLTGFERTAVPPPPAPAPAPAPAK